jgi:hypothetical protein
LLVISLKEANMNERPETSKPHDSQSSPASDPTNPWSQESTGEWVTSEKNNEQRLAEPGMTEADHQNRNAQSENQTTA